MEYCIASIDQGLTKEMFIEGLKKWCESSGWYGGKYDHLIDDPTQREKIEKYLNWRLSVIYRTNITTSYLSGRYRQMLRVSNERPIWIYSAVMDDRTRPEHRGLNGKAFRFDSSFWDIYYPPNGWNCRCSVYSLAESTAKERGLEIEDKDIPDLTYTDKDGIEKMINWKKFCPKEWRYNPGKEKFMPDWSKYSYLNNYEIGTDDKGKTVYAIDLIKQKYITDMKKISMTKGEWDYYIDSIHEKDYKEKNIDMLVSVIDKKITDNLNIDPKVYVTDKTLLKETNLSKEDIKLLFKILNSPKYITKESDSYIFSDDYDDKNLISIEIKNNYVIDFKIIPKD